jgi:phasin family protein
MAVAPRQPGVRAPCDGESCFVALQHFSCKSPGCPYDDSHVAVQHFSTPPELFMTTTFNVDALLSAQKAAATEAQVLASTAFAGFEKLVALNLGVARSALTQTTPDLVSALGAKNPTDALAAQASLVKPLAEQAIAYGRSVYAIATDVGSELSKAAEAQVAAGQKQLDAAVDVLSKNAPAGSEPLVSAYKTAVSAGQNAIAVAKSSALKAVEMADKQTHQLVENALSAVKTPSRKK